MKPTRGAIPIFMNWWPGCGRGKPKVPPPVRPGKVTVAISRPAPQALRPALELAMIADAEKEILAVPARPVRVRPRKPIKFSRPKPRPPVTLADTAWRCFYSIEDVAGLTVEQADRLLDVRSSTLKTLYRVVSPKALKRLRRRCTRSGTTSAPDTHHWFEFHSDGVAPTIETEINYPLHVTVKLTIAPLKTPGRCRDERLTPGYLLWQVARQYVRIYREAEASERGRKKYGIWGHRSPAQRPRVRGVRV